MKQIKFLIAAAVVSFMTISCGNDEAHNTVDTENGDTTGTSMNHIHNPDTTTPLSGPDNAAPASVSLDTVNNSGTATDTLPR